MSEVAIQVDNLSKAYQIGNLQNGDQRFGYSSLRDVLTTALASPVRRAKRLLGGQAYAATDTTKILWALKDVSFEIKRGEVIGIIGRNGAGKSTLLKILSRITEPTTGTATIYGRVGSLLEVGTGFHPELTGRENIYLNGAILGMKRTDIARQFDEIIAFAEVEKFIDTPVKHYSSGMYLRLAFAVAAHLEPDILLIDEILAVGDFEFQQKCFGKMGDISQAGKTVLLVSHHLHAIESLCNRCILLNDGQVEGDNQTTEIIKQYIHSTVSQQQEGSKFVRHIDENSYPPIHFVEVQLLVNGEQRNTYRSGDAFEIRLLIRNISYTKPFTAAFSIKTVRGEVIFVSHHHDNSSFSTLEPGQAVMMSAVVMPNLLMPGNYLIDIGINDESWGCLDLVRDVLSFQILPLPNQFSLQDKRPGLLYLSLDWTCQSVE